MTVLLGRLLLAGPVAEAAHSHPTWADFGPTEWVTIVLAGVAGGWAIWKAVMLTLHPGEEDAGHIKRMILEDPPPLQVSVTSRGAAPSGPEDEVASG